MVCKKKEGRLPVKKNERDAEEAKRERKTKKKKRRAAEAESSLSFALCFPLSA